MICEVHIKAYLQLAKFRGNVTSEAVLVQLPDHIEIFQRSVIVSHKHILNLTFSITTSVLKVAAMCIMDRKCPEYKTRNCEQCYE